MLVQKTLDLGKQLNPFTGKLEKCYTKYDTNLRVVTDHSKKKAKVTDFVAICCGNVVEIKHYEKSLVYNFESTQSNSLGKKKNHSEKRSDSVNRAKHKLRQLINTNVTKNSKFVTLTFAENIKDVKQAKIIFKNFIKRFNYYLSLKNQKQLKYVYVVEFQDENNRGAVHFHVIFFNLNFIKSNILEKIWDNGFVKINLIKHVDNVGAYVVKYMNKGVSDERLTNSDLYGRSRGNLREPLVIKDRFQVLLIMKQFKQKICYFKSFVTEHLGKVEYIQFNTNRNFEKNMISEKFRTYLYNFGKFYEQFGLKN
ncbi:TPA: hypothetical protein ACG7AG_002668 [Clostridium perfringens]